MFARSVYNALWLLDELLGTRGFAPFHHARKALHGRLTQPRGLSTRIARVPELRVDYLDAVSLRKLEGSGPVLFKGLAAKIPAIKEWTLPALAKRCGLKREPIQRSSAQYYERDELRPADVLESIEAGGSSHFLYDGTFAHLLKEPRMREELKLSSWMNEAYLQRALFRAANLFVSAAGHWTPIHTEVSHVLSVQVRGSRRWTMYAPTSSPELFPEVRGGTTMLSRLYANATRLREENFGLRGWECVTEEGDVLFCPAYHWHFVETLRTSVSAAPRWSTARSLFAHPMMTSLFTIRMGLNFLRSRLGDQRPLSIR